MVMEFENDHGVKVRKSFELSDHADSAASEIRWVGTGEYSAPMKYSEETRTHRLGYGPVEDRRGSHKITRPVKDIAELDKQFHIEAQFHDWNRSAIDDIEEYDNDGSALFDLVLLDLFDTVCEIEAINPNAVPVEIPVFKTIYIMETRGLMDPENRSSVSNVQLKEYRQHLEEYPEVARELGLRDPSDQLGKVQLLPKVQNFTADLWEKLERASKRALFAAFRNGFVPPETASTKYNFSKQDHTINESNIDRPTKRQDLRNWIQELAPKTIDSLTFGRDDPERSLFDFLGLFASAAKIGTAVGTAADVSDWNYDREEIIGPGLPSKYIKNRLTSDRAINQFDKKNKDAAEIPSIEKQFEAVHKNTIEAAKDRGFFDGPQALAIDNVKIDWSKEPRADTVSVPPNPTNDVSEQWMFTVVSIVNSGSRFTIGAKLLNDKADYPDIAMELMDEARKHFKVGSVYVDAESVSGDLIEYIHEVAGKDGIIKCPKRDGDIANLPVLTPDDRAGYVENVPYNVENAPNPNLIAFPHPSNFENQNHYEQNLGTPIEFNYEVINQDDATDLIKGEDRPAAQTSFVSVHAGEGGTDSNTEEEDPEAAIERPIENEDKKSLLSFETDINHLPSLNVTKYRNNHETYLTYRTVPKTSPVTIFKEYKRRWSIEESMNQFKNHFLPKTESQHPEMRIYYLNVAILFQNWYTLVNRSPSPKYQLRLDPTPEEVLQSVEDLAFSEEPVL